MPAFAFERQPDALAWFGSERGRHLLALEGEAARHWLERRPAQPALWLTAAAEPPPPPAGNGFSRRLWLYRQGAQLRGDVHCALPLPLPSETFGSVVLQHACDDGSLDLLSECARILAPGGRLWLLTLNPMSPYRLRWRGSDLRVRDGGAWHERLRQVGLHPQDDVETYLGPRWRGQRATDAAMRPSHQRLRAVRVLEAEKRVAALIPPANARRAWNTGAAPA